MMKAKKSVSILLGARLALVASVWLKRLLLVKTGNDFSMR